MTTDRWKQIIIGTDDEPNAQGLPLAVGVPFFEARFPTQDNWMVVMQDPRGRAFVASNTALAGSSRAPACQRAELCIDLGKFAGMNHALGLLTTHHYREAGLLRALVLAGALRGCAADLAELQADYRQFLSAHFRHKTVASERVAIAYALVAMKADPDWTPPTWTTQ